MAKIDESDIPKTFQKVINDITSDAGFPKYKLEIEALNSNGGNYMGDIFTLDIIEDVKDEPNKPRGRVLNLFAKVSNVPENQRHALPAKLVYEREEFAYTTLRKIFTDMQEKHDVSEEKRFKFAKYYGSQVDDIPEVIVLENLKKNGYTMYDRLRCMDWEFASAGVRELARFHALSFVFQRQDTQQFDTLIRSIQSMQGQKTPDESKFAEFRRLMEDSAFKSLNEKNGAVVRRYFETTDMFDGWQDHFQPGDKPCVLVHGDYRISNIMVKYEEGTLTSLRALDFQMIFCGSPFNDILYFIFTGSDSAFREEHFDKCVQLYYDTLAESLALLSQDINIVYPRTQFMEDLKDKLIYALFLGIYMLPVILVDPDSAPKITDIIDGNRSQLGNDLYAERLNGVVDDLLRWGVL